jgi:fructose-1,6-bisphosphatase/inositol monophosphatase family enzyme
MTGWNTDSVIDLLLECAEIARRIKSDPEIEIKDDRTPVSNADKGIEELLTQRLGAENVLGEESFQKRNHEQLIDRLLHGRIWIVDPIDGTANFINRRPLWGITIGYAENGIITRGGVFLPEFGQLMITGDDGKTLYSGADQPYPDAAEVKNLLVPAKHPGRAFNETSCINLSQVFTKKGTFTGRNPVIAIGSCICSGMDLLLGRDAVYMTHAKLWDMAGILPCLANLGFYAVNRSGLSLMDCRITPELFQLEAGAKIPFALREMHWIGSSRDAVETIMPLCRV